MAFNPQEHVIAMERKAGNYPIFFHVNENCQCEGRRCKTCEKLKCIDSFYRDRRSKNTIKTECKICYGRRVRAYKEAHKDEVTAGAAWYYKKSGQRHRRHHLKKLYGLTESQYTEMKERQNGACAICGIISQKPLHIDHNHTTGKVRALLCTQCNSMLGYARDSVEMLRKGVEYLESYSEGVKDNGQQI